MFNTTNDSKIFITSKTEKKHIKQLRMDTNTQKMTWLNDNIISKNTDISCNMIFEMSFLMNTFL